MPMEKFKKLVEEYLLAFIALILAIVSGILLFHVEETNHWHSPVEALFIASVLAVLVDPYLKQKFFIEANRDIFHLLLGFSLPTKIQLRLRKYLSEIEYYRDYMEVWVRFIDANDGLRLQVEINADIVLVQDCGYSQSISFEEADKGRVDHMDARFASDGVSIYRGASMRLPNPSTDDPMTSLYAHEKVHVEADQKLRSEFKFSITAENKSHWSYVFGSTTAKSIVHLDPGSKMEMFISSPFHWDDEKQCYVCNEVLTKNERFTIRWRPKGSVTATAKSAPNTVAGQS